MADTTRTTFEKGEVCDDCQQGNIGELCFKHWGPLVPPSTEGTFCPTCMNARNQEYQRGSIPRPIGILPDISTQTIQA